MTRLFRYFVAWRPNKHFRSAERGHAGFIEQILDRNRDAGECVQLCAAEPTRVDLVSSGERFVLVHLQEGARAFSLRVLDRRERLFDELTTGNFLASEKMRKVVTAHHIAFAARPALRESRIETPERPPSKCKSAQPGGV